MKSVIKIAVLSLLLWAPARAEEIETSTGVVCNTQKQVERFVALNDANPQAAIEAVNAEAHDPTACAVASLAFMRGGSPVMVRSSHAAFQIVPILVIGIVTEEGVQAVVPAIYFSLFRVDERAA